MYRFWCPGAIDSHGYISPKHAHPHRIPCIEQYQFGERVPYGKRTMISVRGAEILEKELAVKKEQGSKLEESQEGESKLEMVSGVNKPDRACIVPPVYK